MMRCSVGPLIRKQKRKQMERQSGSQLETGPASRGFGRSGDGTRSGGQPSMIVEHLHGTDDVCWLEQVPASIRLLRAGTDGDRVHMVLWQVEFLESTEHIYSETWLARLILPSIIVFF